MKLLRTVDDWLTRLSAQWIRLRPHLAASWRIARQYWRALWLQTHPVRAIAEALIRAGAGAGSGLS